MKLILSWKDIEIIMIDIFVSDLNATLMILHVVVPVDSQEPVIVAGETMDTTVALHIH